jgi:hypothetical protein
MNDFYFLEFFLKIFFFGVLHQAVRAVSKNRPKYPMLDIPFKKNDIRLNWSAANLESAHGFGRTDIENEQTVLNPKVKI